MTSQEQKVKPPPDAEAILKQFRSPLVRLCRFVLLTGLIFVKWIRRVKWETTGISRLNNIESPVIFASNHQSHVDTHVITHTLPKSFRKRTAVAAAFDHFADSDGTSKKKRIVQFLVAALWYAFGIERINFPLRSIRTMQDLLLRGWSIVIYPEGTRSRTGKIAQFKGGLALVAKKSGRPVVPVYVKGGLGVLPEATYIPHPGVISVSYGEPLHFHQDETSKEFMERVEAAVRYMANRE
ncbi:MAG: lysophospholipid acyltransferase family protein [Phycisphaerales bacterium]|jgi:1-acyl-sn-glycerol-3-phosphate acyltransferase|nr:lysophospholipid acyltransferase family protein [Phycisphaerales bacterium]